MTQVLFEKEKWFAWVRETQKRGENEREREQKKTRQEAVVFRRHTKCLEERLETLRKKEEQKRQDAYLEQAYQERLSETAVNQVEEDWDPIVDTEQNRRDMYLDLIRHFLWMEAISPGRPPTVPVAKDPSARTKPQEASNAPKKKKTRKKTKEATRSLEIDAPSSNVAMVAAKLGQLELLSLAQSGKLDGKVEPKKSTIESETEMRTRLSQNVTRKAIRVGVELFLPSHLPPEPIVAAPLMSDDDIEDIVVFSSVVWFLPKRLCFQLPSDLLASRTPRLLSIFYGTVEQDARAASC